MSVYARFVRRVHICLTPRITKGQINVSETGNMEKWKYFSISLAVGWITTTYIIISAFKCGDKIVKVAKLKQNLKSKSAELEKLDPLNIKNHHDHGPWQEYEKLRRRIYSNTKELWYFIHHRLSTSTKDVIKADQTQNLLKEVGDRKRLLISDQEKLTTLDGYDAWRQREAASVSTLVQKRLYYIQHPPDCRAARKIVCDHDNCGFGCQLHHIAYCLIFAYATERTLILNKKGWRYSNRWEDTFYPLSKTCNSTYDDKVRTFSVSETAKVVSLPVLYLLSPKPKFLPLAIPEDLADRIFRFNGDPASWWIAQMIKYILKPRTHIQKVINGTLASLNLKSPIVGLHVRRTDKIDTEAEYFEIEEYMTHVTDYYSQLELSHAGVQRRVFLASDDHKLLQEAREKYPEYSFDGDRERSKTAATHRRYNQAALTSLLVDLHVLASCDYLVCTFSSQFCLLAYEMMQTNRADASTSVYSLDDLYHFVGQNPHTRIIIPNLNLKHYQDHKINVSDLWTGYNYGGKRLRDGMIPWYKTADHVELYPFPEYKQVAPTVS